jgi:hypothetical protein
MSGQDQKPYGEKEALEALTEHGRKQHDERAIAGIRTAIGSMDDDGRKAVLEKALKEMNSVLVVRKSGE